MLSVSYKNGGVCSTVQTLGYIKSNHNGISYLKKKDASKGTTNQTEHEKADSDWGGCLKLLPTARAQEQRK